MCLAVPGRLLAREPAADALDAVGTVDFGGVRRRVSLACVPEARAGDLLLVHAGIAIALVDEAAGARLASAVDEVAATEPSSAVRFGRDGDGD